MKSHWKRITPVSHLIRLDLRIHKKGLIIEMDIWTKLAMAKSTNKCTDEMLLYESGGR